LKFTILTPSYNQGAFLERNIDSVRNQDVAGTQHIICDGGSKDNTVEILKKHSNHLGYWVSEPDGGQTPALNKGLAKAENEILGWLNVDEYYEPNIFARVAKLFEADPKLVMVYGDFNRVKADGSLIRRNRQWRFDYDVCQIQTPIVMNCAAFFRRSRVVECGGFNEKYKYVMDWEFYIRLMKEHERNWKRIPAVLGNFTMHPDSKTAKDDSKFNAEIAQLRQSVFPDLTKEQIEARRLHQLKRMKWHIIKDGLMLEKVYFAIVRRRHFDDYYGSPTKRRPFITPLLDIIDPVKKSS